MASLDANVNITILPYDENDSVDSSKRYIGTQAQLINMFADEVHKANKKWWTNIKTGEPLERNVGEMLMLIVSEIAEAMEGHRKGLKDDHIVTRPMTEVELADATIRIFDVAAGLGYDLGGAIVEKLAYNAQRADHKIENRLKDGGKKY